MLPVVFPTFAPDVRRRWIRNAPFLIIGTAGMIAGGFVAAVAGAVDWGHGAWTAAFVVLVVGVAQVILGLAQAVLAPVLLTGTKVALQCTLWNLGCAGVIAGTQISSPVVVAIGSILFLAALAMSELTVRSHSELSGTPATLLNVYRVLLVVLFISVFIGIILSFSGN